jgi:hypothetical protein
MLRQIITTKLSQYKFQIKHIAVFLVVLIIFQIILAFVQNNTLNEFLVETQSWYQKYSAESMAIVTSTSMELLFENLFLTKTIKDYDERNITYSFNVIFKQQLIQKSVSDICLILVKNNRLYVIDSGHNLYRYLSNNLLPCDVNNNPHSEGVDLFLSQRERIKRSETVYSTLKNQKTFNILVPFVPNGEYLGVMYMKITPDFSFISKEVSSNFDKVALIYFSLILFGFIAIFIVSSQAVKERNEAQKKLFDEHQENIKKQIRLEKESLFTKRIYHTHHKAEKIIGFIKDDVRGINHENMEKNKKRVITYSNFISRIIYDMKWYDQEINTIINPMFRTNINEVIKFVVQNVFLRISSKNEMFGFEIHYDDTIPLVNVNEFVVWEILEPLIQNCIDHGNKKFINVTITTKYDGDNNITYLTIQDNGVGVNEELLQQDENGVKKIFLENVSSKKNEGTNSGYGCYIAYQMAVEKCGWVIDVSNMKDAGCKFTISIINPRRES